MLTYTREEILASYGHVLDQVKNFVQKNELLDLRKISSLKFTCACDSAIFELLLSHLIKAESLSPGAPDVLIRTLLNSRCETTSAVAFSLESLDQLLRTFAKENEKDLVKDALTIAGLHGKIVLSPAFSNGEKDLVELTVGSFFSDVFPAFNLKSTKFLDPKVLCIDGFVESVSEIHRILEDASQSKETVIMFLRGLADDVAHTLKVNYDRGTLSVIPVITKYDLDGVNLLNDISVVTGGDIVSSLKGQLISSIDIFSYPRVSCVDITSTGVIIENPSTSSAVDLHIHQLQKKILESEFDATKEIISRRVHGLGSRRVTIKLRDSQERTKKSFMIDQCLRAVKSAATFGIGKWNSKNLPLASIKVGKEFAEKFSKTIDDLGAVVQN